MTTPMEHTLKLKRIRPLSNARLAESKAARLATATAHDGLDRYLRAVNYLAAAECLRRTGSAEPSLSK